MCNSDCVEVCNAKYVVVNLVYSAVYKSIMERLQTNVHNNTVTACVILAWSLAPSRGARHCRRDTGHVGCGGVHVGYVL